MKEKIDIFALTFTQLLLDKQFNQAHRMLSVNLQKSLLQTELAKTYMNMVAYFKSPANHIEVVDFMEEWPEKAAHDIAWTYVSVDNGSQAEAVILIVENIDKQLAIRHIEWGRP